MKKLLVLISIFMVVQGIFAQEGSRDSTFNSVGYTLTNGYYGSKVVEAIQPDGKIVVAGKNNSNQRVVLRYNTNGSLDATFNGTGIVTTASGNGFNNPSSVLIQTDGKIVVVGAYFNGGYDDHISLIRYNSDGSLDNTFGTAGIVSTSIGASEDRVGKAVLQSDGKIVVGAHSLDSWTGAYSFTVLRYTTAGVLDATFNTTGYNNINLGCSNFGDYNSLPYGGVNLQSDGKILFAGSFGTSQATRDMICIRLNTDGKLDSTFNGVAYKTIDLSGNEDFANDVAVDNNGKILLGGKRYYYAAVARLNPSGSLDSTFGNNGSTYFDLGNSAYCNVQQINVLPDNKILVGGMAYIGSYNIAIARLNYNGTLDNTFGSSGKVNCGFLGTSQTDGYGHAVQSDGKIVICGGYNQAQFAVVRLKQKAYPAISSYPTASAITYGDNLSASVISGGTVSVPGTWSFNNPTLVSPAGTVSADVTFMPVDFATYASMPGVIPVQVNAKALTVSGATAQNKPYDGTTPAIISGATLQGVVGTDDVVLNNATTGVFAQSSIGTGIAVSTSMTISGAAVANYTLTAPTGLSADITAKELTVSGAVADNKIYDGTTNATISGATLQGVVGTENVTLNTIMTGVFAQKDTGTAISVTAALTLSGSDIANYSLTQPTGLSANITAKELTVTGATAVNKIYDGTTVAGISGAALQGVVGTENVTLNTIMTGVFAQKDTGTAIPVTAALTLSGSDIANYSLTQPTGLSANITALEITIGGSFEVADKPFDGNTSASIVTNNLTLVNTIAGDNVSLSNVVAEFVSSAQGTNINVVITGADLTGSDATNYILILTGAPTTQADITSGVGMNEQPELTVSVWPNPAADHINISYAGTIATIRILNNNGQLVLSITGDNTHSVRTDNLEPGLYFIQIQSESGDILTGKFLKD